MASAINDCIVLFGDSQTEFGSKPGGLANRLSHHYSRIFDVVNRGFSGYTTDQALILAPRLFHETAQGSKSGPSGSVRLVTVWFGSNDAAVEGHRQHVPLQRFRDNLHAILDVIEARAESAKILLLTPVTLISSTDRVGESRRPEITRTYVDAILEVAQQRKSLKIVGVDLYSLFQDLAAGHIGSMQPLLLEDGLHISDLGYELIFHKLTSTIAQHWPELDVKHLQATYPLWRDVLPESGQPVQLEPRNNLIP
ncbi:hypothetical protein CF319_g1707 [Tilletia indica]|uniref:SGNH hydrolase-type esterase domain-containing protein n=1 Tax=Tilletia indica TaxID=43049 RepID=A0A177TLQ1_9BASI|nr:hypothetical protein CF319_g1707 [Tilletia indica]KAE8251159.1 hypothetical protein A4X13_0g4128 [Tilletia indica]